MRYFKTKEVKRWARSEQITDVHLMQLFAEYLAGLQGSDLGNGLHKKRISLNNNKGKSGGGRMIFFYKTDESVVFCASYSKKDKSNISDIEKKELELLAKVLNSLTDEQYNKYVEKEVLFEIE